MLDDLCLSITRSLLFYSSLIALENEGNIHRDLNFIPDQKHAMTFKNPLKEPIQMVMNHVTRPATF